ncbi:MAG: hypothetical protein DRG50_01830, partial [Deltaproteobacteria bacterium]
MRGEDIRAQAEQVLRKEREQDLQRLKAELAMMREKCSRLKTLSRLSGLLNSSLDFEYVKRKATEAAAELLNCEASSLLLK